MKFLRKIIFLLFFSPSLLWANTEYSCKFIKNYNASFQYPQEINIVINFSENRLEKYYEDDIDFTDEYYCEKCLSDTLRIEIWKNNYTPWSLEQINIENARVFEIYASDLVGHLWRPTKNGIDYQCKKS